MTIRKHTQARGWAIGIGQLVIRPTMVALTRREWIGGSAIPHTGGAMVVVNHISYADPLVTAHFFYSHGRVPRYLAKAGLWKNKFLKPLLNNARQIPVERLTESAAGAYESAVEAVHRGDLVVVYPEGTITRDPGLWPMTGKTGAARIALATRCPVIPVGQWGAQDLMPPYTGKLSVSLKRPVVRLQTGDPIDLSDLYDQEPTPEVVAEATDRIMAAITAIVAELRGTPAPAERFDSRRAGVKEIGNPHPSEGRHDQRPHHGQPSNQQHDQTHDRQEGDA